MAQVCHPDNLGVVDGQSRIRNTTSTEKMQKNFFRFVFICNAFLLPCSFFFFFLFFFLFLFFVFFFFLSFVFSFVLFFFFFLLSFFLSFFLFFSFLTCCNVFSVPMITT